VCPGFSLAELRQLQSDGEVTWVTQIWAEDFGDEWMSLGEFLSEMYGGAGVLDEPGGDLDDPGGDLLEPTSTDDDSTQFWVDCSYSWKTDDWDDTGTVGHAATLADIQMALRNGEIDDGTEMQVQTADGDVEEWETLSDLKANFDGFELALLRSYDEAERRYEQQRAGEERERQHIAAQAARQAALDANQRHMRAMALSGAAAKAWRAKVQISRDRLADEAADPSDIGVNHRAAMAGILAAKAASSKWRSWTTARVMIGPSPSGGTVPGGGDEAQRADEAKRRQVAAQVAYWSTQSFVCKGQRGGTFTVCMSELQEQLQAGKVNATTPIFVDDLPAFQSIGKLSNSNEAFAAALAKTSWPTMHWMQDIAGAAVAR
jgi:hypothetical protein